MTAHDIDLAEQRVLADVTALDRAMQIAARLGETLKLVADWTKIRAEIGPVRTPRRPYVGMASRVRAAGVGNLAGLLREILAAGAGPMWSYQIKSAVDARVRASQADAQPAISGDQVDAALARLVKRGEVRRIRHGLYEASQKKRAGSPR